MYLNIRTTKPDDNILKIKNDLSDKVNLNYNEIKLLLNSFGYKNITKNHFNNGKNSFFLRKIKYNGFDLKVC